MNSVDTDTSKEGQKFWLTFTGKTIKKRILCKLGRVVPEPFEYDIRQTTMFSGMALMAVGFFGPPESIETAIEFLEKNGVMVKPLEGNVFE